MAERPTKSFRTHSNYIRAFDLLVHNPGTLGHRDIFECLKERIFQSNALPQSTSSSTNLDQIQSILHSAWGTEALLLMTKRIIDEEELLRLSNNWSCIQVYYIFYHCTQALHVAKGHPRPESHPSTQNVFNDYWAARSIFLPPWSLAYGAAGVINTPSEITPDISIHPWTACEGDNIWHLASKALMTTRREALNEKYHEKRELKKKQSRRTWKQQESNRLAAGKKARREPYFPLPKLSNSEKNSINAHLRSYTIIDYLYRLRLKTNYEDSNMFSDGPEENDASRYVRDALCRIASATLFLHELAICNFVGRRPFLTWIDEWVQHNLPRNTVSGLASRRRHI